MNDVIPWYRSNTIRALIVAGLAQLVSLFNLGDDIKADQITVHVDNFLAAVTFIATAYAGWARARQPTPPITKIAAARAVEREVKLQTETEVANGFNSPLTKQSKQRGFARPLMLAMLLSLGVLALPALQGCATMGLEAAETDEQKIAYTVAAISGVQRATATALRANKITQADGREVLRLADSAQPLLDSAKALEAAGDKAGAGLKVELARDVLDSIKKYLAKRGVKV